VTIATALMPGHCTAGYGLALGSLKFFLGVMYLYSINCVFICVSNFIIVKYLKYPVKKKLDNRDQKQVQYVNTTLIMALILSNIYYTYLLIEQKNHQHQVNVFMENEFTYKWIAILYKKTNCNSMQKNCNLVFLRNDLVTKKSKYSTPKL
jgi:uncharacterized membrane protein